MSEEIFFALSLAKEGWAGGDPQRILEMPAPLVINMIQFSKFLNEYRETSTAINSEGKA